MISPGDLIVCTKDNTFFPSERGQGQTQRRPQSGVRDRQEVNEGDVGIVIYYDRYYYVAMFNNVIVLIASDECRVLSKGDLCD